MKSVSENALCIAGSCSGEGNFDAGAIRRPGDGEISESCLHWLLGM
jgi:hypothetical protein